MGDGRLALAWYWSPSELKKATKVEPAQHELPLNADDALAATMSKLSLPAFCRATGIVVEDATPTTAEGDSVAGDVTWSPAMDLAVVQAVNMAAATRGCEADNLPPADVVAAVDRLRQRPSDAPSVLPDNDIAILARVCVLRALNGVLLRLVPAVALSPADEPRHGDVAGRHPVAVVATHQAPDMRRATAVQRLAATRPPAGAFVTAADAALMACAGTRDADVGVACSDQAGGWQPVSLGWLLRTYRWLLFTTCKRRMWRRLVTATDTPTQPASTDVYVALRAAACAASGVAACC